MAFVLDWMIWLCLSSLHFRDAVFVLFLFISFHALMDIYM